MRRECRERFPRHRRLAIPTCITARAWRTCRDACLDRWLAVSFEVGAGENAPGIPVNAQPAITYLVSGPWDDCIYHTKIFWMDGNDKGEILTRPWTQKLPQCITLTATVTSHCVSIDHNGQFFQHTHTHRAPIMRCHDVTMDLTCILGGTGPVLWVTRRTKVVAVMDRPEIRNAAMLCRAGSLMKWNQTDHD